MHTTSSNKPAQQHLGADGGDEDVRQRELPRLLRQQGHELPQRAACVVHLQPGRLHHQTHSSLAGRDDTLTTHSKLSNRHSFVDSVDKMHSVCTDNEHLGNCRTSTESLSAALASQ